MDVCLGFSFSAQELVVRLAAIWGDLTAAFGLPTRDAGSEDEHGTWPVALRASKLSVKSMALHLGGFSRYQQLPTGVSRVQLWSFTFSRFLSPKLGLRSSTPPPRKLRRLTMRLGLSLG